MDSINVVFRIRSNLNIEKAVDHIARESSVGTWTEVKTMKPRIKKLQAKPVSIDRKNGLVKMAYPIELFEEGSIPQILSDIAGNIFGMKDIYLRLESAEYPKHFVKTFPGPGFGIEGVRRKLGTMKSKRPHLGTIVKPKVGLNPTETAKVAYDAWVGGLDFVKDDENLTHQKFCPFEERVVKVLDVLDRAWEETGERKMYAANITGNIKDMERRAIFVKEHGGTCIMMDVLTAGFAAVQHIREMNLGMAIHGHRAMHGAFTRIKHHGMSMAFVAGLARFAGVDQLHVGAVVGKMDAQKSETLQTVSECISNNGLKKVFPVASGGLSSLSVPDVVRIFGKDIIIQAGGGVHGHPGGTLGGARAMRQALDAVLEGVSIEEYAKRKEGKELALALREWGKK